MLATLLLLACQASAPTTCDTGPDDVLPTVELGGGDYMSWVPIDDGDPLTMIHAPAGGWVFMLGARLTGFDDVVELELRATATELGRTTLCNHPYRVKTTPDPDDPTVATFTEMYCYIDVRALEQGDLDTPPELLAGEEIELHVDAFDQLGAGRHDSLTIIAELDPKDME